jgi:hypothetical protein
MQVAFEVISSYCKLRGETVWDEDSNDYTSCGHPSVCECREAHCPIAGGCVAPLNAVERQAQATNKPSTPLQKCPLCCGPMQMTWVCNDSRCPNSGM